jgi:hypothetical protein
MFFKKKDHLTDESWREISGRYANLFVHCYKKRDVTGMQVTVTALTHLCYGLRLGERSDQIQQLFREYVLKEGFPEAELSYLDWLLNHFFEREQEHPAEYMLPWYQKVDDEWLLRQKLRAEFPDKNNTELTALLMAEIQRRNAQ